MPYPYYPQYQQPQQQQAQTPGIIQVPNENYVYNYPVGPVNSVMFKIEGKPIIMEKSMGFSQFESPKIDVYRLVKEEPQEPATTDYKSDIDALWAEINALKEKATPTPKKKKEVTEDAE